MDLAMNYPAVSFPKLGIKVDRIGQTLLAITLVLTMFLTACSVDQMLADISILIETASAIGTAVGAVSPADAAAIQVLSSTALLALNTIKTLYDTWRASGATTDLQKLQTALATLKTNLPQVLLAAHIVDPNAVAIVTKWVGLVISVVTSIIDALPQFVSGAVSTKKKMKLAASMPTAKSIKARWNAEVCLNDAPCSALVK